MSPVDYSSRRLGSSDLNLHLASFEVVDRGIKTVEVLTNLCEFTYKKEAYFVLFLAGDPGIRFMQKPLCQLNVPDWKLYSIPIGKATPLAFNYQVLLLYMVNAHELTSETALETLQIGENKLKKPRSKPRLADPSKRPHSALSREYTTLTWLLLSGAP